MKSSPRIARLLLLCAYCETLSSVAMAAPGGRGAADSILGLSGTGNSPTLMGSEYVSEPVTTRGMLIPVNVLGAVAKPGVHHVPIQSDLVQVLSLAGGTTMDADNSIIVRRRQGGQDTITRLKTEEALLSSSAAVQMVAPNDLIYVKRKERAISEDTTSAVAIVTGIVASVAAVLTAVAVSKK